MDFLVPKKSYPESRDPQEQEEPESVEGGVTSFLYLKPWGQASAAEEQRGVLDKDVVLRRIRQRKRANTVRSAIQAVVGGMRGSKGSVSSETERRWLDDAFSAP